MSKKETNQEKVSEEKPLNIQVYTPCRNRIVYANGLVDSLTRLEKAFKKYKINS